MGWWFSDRENRRVGDECRIYIHRCMSCSHHIFVYLHEYGTTNRIYELDIQLFKLMIQLKVKYIKIGLIIMVFCPKAGSLAFTLPRDERVGFPLPSSQSILGEQFVKSC